VFASPSVLLLIIPGSATSPQATRGWHVVGAACPLRAPTVGTARVASASGASAELLEHLAPSGCRPVVGANRVVYKVTHCRVDADRPRSVGPRFLPLAESVKDGRNAERTTPTKP
jgi:hypothetical protein